MNFNLPISIPKKARDETIAERRAICGSCENLKTKIGVDYCGLCNCPIRARTLINVNKCSGDFWGPELEISVNA